MAASDIEHARALLEMAKRDHRALSRMLDPQDFAEEIFGFHAQQVVEKAGRRGSPRKLLPTRNPMI
jgi:hypothetical protein